MSPRRGPLGLPYAALWLVVMPLVAAVTGWGNTWGRGRRMECDKCAEHE